MLLMRALHSQGPRCCRWLYECFPKEAGRLLFGSKDSNAAFVSTPLMLAGTPESLASQKHKQSLIVPPTGHRLLQATPLSATHRKRHVLSRTHRLNGRFLSRDHKQLSIEMETH